MSSSFILRDMQSSCDFNQSAIMHPIPINIQQTKPKNGKNMNKINNTFSRITQKNNNPTNTNIHINDYQQYKLKSLLGYQVIDDFETDSQKTIPSITSEPVIQIITIDPYSLILEINDHFTEFMKKYTAYDITLISVTGDTQVGKSLFCDKVLNLAQVRGNHFSKNENKPGLYIWQRPFIKDNLCIFLVQIGGCALKDTTFRILNSIALLITSQYVLINSSQDRQNKALSHLTQHIKKCMKAFELPENTQPYFPTTIHNLQRFQLNSDSSNNPPYPFLDLHSHYLPQAKTPSYRGPDNDLRQVPFLVSQVVNPAYIEAISQIFKNIHKLSHNKKIIIDNQHEIILNGNILNKVLQHCVHFLNSHKKIKIQKMYEQILRQLYLSAFNYCVMIYHDQLSQNFDDQQPKSIQQVLQIFQISKQKTLLEFSNFNLSKSLYSEYQNKLQAHIDAKQQLILEVNRIKIEQKLKSELDYHNNGNPQKQLQLLQTYRTQLNDGRDNLIKQLLCRMYKNAGNGTDMRIYQQIQKLNHNLQQKQDKLAKLRKDNAQKQKIIQQKKQQFLQYNKKISQIDNQIIKTKQNIKNKKKMAQNIKQGTRSKEDIQVEIQQLKKKVIKKKQQKQQYKNNNQDNSIAELKAKYQKKINPIVQQQRVIQQKLSQLKKQAVQGKSTNASKMKPNATQGSNIKNSQTKPPKKP